MVGDASSLKSPVAHPLRCKYHHNDYQGFCILNLFKITLPTSLTFSRNSSIPYFVVFTTTPRSPELAKEIAADATVSVTLVREALLSEQPGLPLTPPLTPTSEESDMGFRPRLLRRVGRSNSRMTRPRGQSDASITQTRNKPLPQLPPLTRLSQTDTLHSNMSIGFPKRPRQMCDGQKHPSLEAMAAMPDGLYKSKIPLNGDIIPCLDWAGVSVKVSKPHTTADVPISD